MKRFCKFFKEHAMEIINFKKKKNDVIKKQTAEIMSKCKNVLYL